MPNWRWLPNLARYYDFDTHRIISTKQVLQWERNSLSTTSDTVGGLADDLAEGRLNVGDWESLMRDAIKQEYIRQYLLGGGGLSQMTQKDWGSLGGMIRDQYRYLDKFADAIASGTLTPGRIRQRALMYINSAQEAYWRATERAYGMPPLPAFPGDGSTMCLCITTPSSRVLTQRGWIPMAFVEVGELVLTHRGRWRPVLAHVVKPSLPSHHQALLRAPTGAVVGATDNHRWFTEDGWRSAVEIDNAGVPVYHVAHETSLREMRCPDFESQQPSGLHGVLNGLSLRQAQGSQSHRMPVLRRQEQGDHPVAEPTPGHACGHSFSPSKAPHQVRGYFRCDGVAISQGRPGVDLVLGRRQEEGHLSLPVDVDHDQRADSRWLPRPSRRWHWQSRPYFQSRTATRERAPSSPRSANSAINQRPQWDEDVRAVCGGFSGDVKERQAAALLFARLQDSKHESGCGQECNPGSLPDLWSDFSSAVPFRTSSAEILFSDLLPGTPLYDLVVAEDHSFVIEGLVAHNTNCRCHWDVTRRLNKRNGKTIAYLATWKLGVAEHCHSDEADPEGRPYGCLERAALWNPLILRVPGQEEKALVPEPEVEVDAKGGPGSGNFGHSGRPGLVGGSGPGTAHPPDAPAIESRPMLGWDAPAYKVNQGQRLPAEILNAKSAVMLVRPGKGVLAADLHGAPPSGWYHERLAATYEIRGHNLDRNYARGVMINDRGDQAAAFYSSELAGPAGVERRSRDATYSEDDVAAIGDQFYSCAETLARCGYPPDRPIVWLFYDGSGPTPVRKAEVYGRDLIGQSAKGGPGSGNFRHAGRPGQVGGSAPSNGAPGIVMAPAALEDDQMQRRRKEATARIAEWRRNGMDDLAIARNAYEWQKSVSDPVLQQPQYRHSHQWDWALYEATQRVAQEIGYRLKNPLTEQDVLDDPWIDVAVLPDWNDISGEADEVVTNFRNTNRDAPMERFLNLPTGQRWTKLSQRELWGQVVADQDREHVRGQGSSPFGATRHFDKWRAFPGLQALRKAKTFEEALDTDITIYRGQEQEGKPRGRLVSCTTVPEVARLFAEGYYSSMNRPGTGHVYKKTVKLRDIAGYINPDNEFEVILRQKQWGQKGGPGSGNFGHAGRPGLVGGSAAAGAPGPVAGGATLRDLLPIDRKVKPKVRRAAEHAHELIASVHGMGPASGYKQIPIEEDDALVGDGMLETMGAYTPTRLLLTQNTNAPVATAVHEMGHYLDVSGGTRWYEDPASGEVRKLAVPLHDDHLTDPLFDAINRSRGIKALEASEFQPNLVIMDGGERFEYEPDRRFIDYLRQPAEVFARAYAQWISTKTGDPQLGQELAQLKTAEPHRVKHPSPEHYQETHLTYPWQWEDDDFAPIAREFDNLFSKLGWMEGTE